MKRLIGILVLASLAVNATLVAALVTRRLSSDRARPPAQSPAGADSQTASRNRGDAAKPAAAVRAGAGAESTPARTLWERLGSRDPAAFAANLRQAGFPLGAIRGAIYALLRDLQTPERVKAVESLPVEPYWKPTAGPLGSPEYYKEISRLWHERDRIMRSLFLEEQLAFTLRLQVRYGKLAGDKLEKLSVLERDYTEMRIQLMQSQSGGLRMPWSSDQLNFLEQEKRKDIAAILTPAELDEYDLRASNTAMSLQRQLAGFNATEKEFRDLYRLRAPFDENMRSRGFAMAGDVGPATTELASQIKNALGEARYADYERATDPGVQSVQRIAERLNLPASPAAAVYQLQREMREREAAIQASTAQAPAQREAQFTALAEEARQKLSTLLTPQGVDQYRAETGGRSLPILERMRTPRR